MWKTQEQKAKAVEKSELIEDYQKRCEMLLASNIALWDVIHSAERNGSLDTAIKDETVNDFVGFLDRHRGIV